VDHDIEFNCKVYENGRVVAGPETLRRLANFSERQIGKETGVIRLLEKAHGQAHAVGIVGVEGDKSPTLPRVAEPGDS